MSIENLRKRHPHDVDTSAENVKAEVLEGCLWILKRRPLDQKRVQKWIARVNEPDSWWRRHYHRTLAWWLTEAGVTGFESMISAEDRGRRRR